MPSIGWLTEKRNPAMTAADRNFRMMPPRARRSENAVTASHFRGPNVYWK
jgi:hypothetical protein